MLGGTYNTPADGTWFEGSAARLIVKYDAAAENRYWDIMAGEIIYPENFTGVPFPSNKLTVTLRLICSPYSRGKRRALLNLLPPFERDWAMTRWALSGGNAQLVSYQQLVAPSLGLNGTSSPPPFGNSILRIDNFTGGNVTLTSPAVMLEGLGTETGWVLPALWLIRDADYQGALTLIIETSTNNSTWNLAQTFGNYTVGSPVPTVWTLKNGTNYNTGINGGFATIYVRAKYTIPTNSVFYFLAPALCHGLAGGAAATVPDEYIGFGGSAGAPVLNVYNVAGDAPAPIKLHISKPIAADGNDYAGGNVHRLAIVGGQRVNWRQETPIFFDEMRTNNGSATTDTACFQNVRYIGMSAVTSAQTLTTAKVGNSQNIIDFKSRQYLALLYYTLNAIPKVNAVRLFIEEISRTYDLPEFLPQTYATTSAPSAASQFKLYALGEFTFGPPGTFQYARRYSDNNTGRTNVQMNVSTSAANGYAFMHTVLFVPQEQFGFVDFGAASGYLLNQRLLISSEGAIPTAGVSNFSRAALTYLADLRPVEGLQSSAYMQGGNFMLHPSEAPGDGMVFVVLLLRDRDAVSDKLFQATASDRYLVGIEYTPRYEM